MEYVIGLRDFLSTSGVYLMAEINLTQAEADALIAMEKHKINDDEWSYPSLGGAISIPLISANKRENFILDIRRARIDLLKGTYQNRAMQVIVLVRLDFGGRPHRNPDEQEISPPLYQTTHSQIFPMHG